MLSPSSERREKILVYGESGSGKSSCWQSIAHWMIKTGAPGRMVLWDTGHDYPAMVTSEFKKIIEVVDADPGEFGEWSHNMHRVRKEVSPDDWVVIDMVDAAWSGAQRHYWTTRSGGDALGEILLRNQTDPEFSLGGDYGINWQVVNQIYDDFFGPFLSLPCHRLALTPAREVQLNARTGRPLHARDADVARFGYRPIGQNRLKYSFHSVLLTQELLGERGVDYTLTTVKEQGPLNYPKRKYLAGEKVSQEGGFVGAYLIGVGGWLP
jgi:energy-coupling factor transporter ATP-binding protein EcfA2